MTQKKLKQTIHEIIFEADTPLGKSFDIVLLIAIILSVVIVILDSVAPLNEKFGLIFLSIEWVLTILFTVEYFIRIYIVQKKSKYIFSFYGIIDFLAILPTYLSLFVVGSHFLMIIRILRLMRVFRVLKLARYINAAKSLRTAFNNSRAKIVVFLELVVALVVIMGSIMYLVEGPENGFTNIPVSIYWAIVTVTTVGYGDIAPQTVFGQTLASLLMIIGYAIIAVPTGLISGEIVMSAKNKKQNTQVCQNCLCDEHDSDAKYCKICGEKL